MATNQQEGNEPVIDIISRDDGSTPAIRVRGESTSGGSLLELRQVGAGAALKLKGDIHLDGDLLDGAGLSGTFVTLTGTETVSGSKAFTGPITWRTSAGVAYVAKPTGDGTAGLIDITNNDTTGYLLHLHTGAASTSPAACIGIGCDAGSAVGLLITNKASGKGFELNQNATVTGVGSNAMRGTQLSTVATLVYLQQAVANAKPLIECWSDANAQAGQKMQVWSGVTNGEFGYVDALSGLWVWHKDTQLEGYLTMSTNATAVRGKTTGGTTFEILKVSSSDNIAVGDVNNTGGTTPLQLCAGGVSSIILKTGGTERLRVDTNGVTVADGKPLIFGTTTGTKIGNATTQKLAFYGTTPVVQPSGTPAAATDEATAITLVNDIRTKLLTLGLIA